MESGRNHNAAGIVALALAFHRVPVKYADLLHGRAPLPPGVDTLLKLAGGSAPAPELAALARPDEIRVAALFFIEQVLFRHDGSHYRVLGLEPGASIAQIKEHHRLLMRMFHPDRERHAGDWKDTYATRINLAYSNLHDQAARRRYDATLKPAMRPAMAPPPVRRSASPYSRLTIPHSRVYVFPPLLLRYLPQWVLAATALLALAIVGGVYVNNPPAPLPAAPPLLAEPMLQESAPNVPAEKKAIAAAEKPPSPAESAKLVQPSVSTAPPPAAVARLDPPIRAAPQLRPVPAPARSNHAVGPADANARSRPTPIASQSSAKQTKVPTARRDATTSPAHVTEKPAAPTPQPEPSVARAAAHPPQLDPEATLAQFLSTYERGDTLAFMALFDDVAISKAGGKSQIRQEYEALIQTTDLRHIAIDNMAWVQEGDWIRGEGRYRTTLMRKGQLKLRTETGTIRIELLRRGGDARIMGLDYLPGARS